MKLPRDLDADRLIRALGRLGYERVRQTGSHVRVRTTTDGEHHETIPSPGILKVGTLAAIVRGLGEHHGLTRDDVLKRLDL